MVVTAVFDEGEPIISRIDWIKARAIEAKNNYGVTTLVIDNLDFLELPEGSKTNEYEAMKVIIPTLAKMAVELNIILVLIAHVRKPMTSGVPKRPYMHDIAGTSLVDRLCDIGFIVNRDRNDDGVFRDTTTVYLENNRPSGIDKAIACLYRDGKLIDSESFVSDLKKSNPFMFD